MFIKGFIGNQDFGVYPNLSAVEFLEYIAAAKGLRAAGRRARRIDELLELVNLGDAASGRWAASRAACASAWASPRPCSTTRAC